MVTSCVGAQTRRRLRGKRRRFAWPSLRSLSLVPLQKVGRDECEDQGETERKGYAHQPNQTRQFRVLRGSVLIAEQYKTERAHAGKMPFDQIATNPFSSCVPKAERAERLPNRSVDATKVCDQIIDGAKVCDNAQYHD